MRERDTLGLALRAGGEQDYRGRGVERVARDQTRHKGADRGKELVQQRELLADVLEIDDVVVTLHRFDDVLGLGEFDEAARGDDLPDLGGLERTADAREPRREVHHRRY